jgi:hypothetical protein
MVWPRRPPSSWACATWWCVRTGRPFARGEHAADWSPFGASSNITGSPQAEFDIPYGNLAQNGGYAMIANRYAAEYGYDPRATAKIAADQRANASANPAAVFRHEPITIDDVLASKMVADPLHLLEIVMPCAGGAAVVVTSADVARRVAKHRPVHVAGFGEHLTHKTPTYAPTCCAHRSDLPPTVSPWQGAAFGHRRRAALRLLHHHRSPLNRGFRLLRQGRGNGLRA